MTKRETITKSVLTPEELDALDMLIGPGPREAGDPYPNMRDECTHTRRWMDIPATSAIPSSPAPDAELLNILKTRAYQSKQFREVAFNPVREYQAYEQLFLMGLVNMTPTEQGSHTVVVEITPAGALLLGKLLVEGE